MEALAEEIAGRLIAARDTGEPSGVLFHGSCETVSGPLRPGMDGLLWTADSPVIAQQYIPRAGLERWISVPASWEEASRVRPSSDCAFYGLAKAMSGLDVSDVKRDVAGDALSWRCPAGWPTYGDVKAHVEETLGYVAENGVWKVSSRHREGVEEYLPASWSVPGTLWMTLADGLDLKDVRLSGESDLTLYEHNGFDLFAQAEREGRDGVVINDFAQTDLYGNFGHVSFGINARGLSRCRWISVPAVRFPLPGDGTIPRLTPEVEEWIDGYANSPAP